MRAVDPLMNDAFYDAGSRHVLERKGAGADHAAEGYAKPSRRVSLALGTSWSGEIANARGWVET